MFLRYFTVSNELLWYLHVESDVTPLDGCGWTMAGSAEKINRRKFPGEHFAVVMHGPREPFLRVGPGLPVINASDTFYKTS